MKKTICILTIFLLVLIVGCNKEETQVPNNYESLRDMHHYIGCTNGCMIYNTISNGTDDNHFECNMICDIIDYKINLNEEDIQEGKRRAAEVFGDD